MKTPKEIRDFAAKIVKARSYRNGQAHTLDAQDTAILKAEILRWIKGGTPEWPHWTEPEIKPKNK